MIPLTPAQRYPSLRCQGTLHSRVPARSFRHAAVTAPRVAQAASGPLAVQPSSHTPGFSANRPSGTPGSCPFTPEALPRQVLVIHQQGTRYSRFQRSPLPTRTNSRLIRGSSTAHRPLLPIFREPVPSLRERRRGIRRSSPVTSEARRDRWRGIHTGDHDARRCLSAEVIVVRSLLRLTPNRRSLTR